MNERAELFRAEVVLNKSDRSNATAIIHQSFSLGLYIWLSSTFLLAAVIVLFLVRYKETETARGYLEPKRSTQKIVAPVVARIEEVNVETGQFVHKDQVLATLITSVFDHSGQRKQEAQINNLLAEEASLSQGQSLRVQHYERSRAMNSAEVGNYRASLEIVQKEFELISTQIALSAASLTSFDQLLESSAISQAQYDREHISHLSLVRQQQETRLRQQEITMQLENLITRHQSLELEFELANLSNQKLVDKLMFQVDQLRNQELFTVVAEEEGVVAAIAITAGQSVIQNQPLLYINPDDYQLQAIIYVSSRVVGKLAPGQSVMLSYDAFSYLHYGRYPATVSEISQASFDPREHLLPFFEISEPVFKIIVTPHQEYVEGPEIYPLQPGFLLTADFVVAEQSLLAYIFNPLFELRGKVF